MKLIITPNGTIRGLWSDTINWKAIGLISVRRASHVEFCERRQQWFVRLARPRSLVRRLVQWLTGRPLGEILHWSPTREEAIAWEIAHFEPGGAAWPPRTAHRWSARSRRHMMEKAQ